MKKLPNIILTGDWHIGSKNDANFVSGWLKKHINKEDQLILMGDLIDSGLDRGMGWDQESVNQQIIYLKKILERYTVLGYVLGNHEMRIHKKAGLNPYQSFLGSETSIYKDYDLFKIAVGHGKSGAQNPVTELLKLSQVYPDANLVALGHNHELGIYMLPHGVIGIRTGTLQRYPDYAKRAIMVPKTLGCIKFDPNTKAPSLIY